VGIRADDADRNLLVPSQVTHHEMRRLHSVSITSLGEPATFRTNSFGLRGPEPASPKPDGVYRVLLLGDETVAGTHLEDSHTLSHRLQQLLRRSSGQAVEVINGGVPGFSPLLSLLQYQRELRQLRPDLIVLHFDMSEVADDAVYRRFLRSADGGQVCANPEMIRSGVTAKPLERLLQTSALAHFFRAKVGGFAEGGSADSPATWSDRSAYLWTQPTPPDLRVQVRHALTPVAELRTLAARENQQLIVSTSPVFWQVVAPEIGSQRAKRYGLVDRNPVTRDLPFQILRTFCEQSQLRLCDSTSAFRDFAASASTGDARDTANSLFEPDSTRLSKYGTALYAREIAGMLLDGSTQPAEPVQSTQRPVPTAR